MKTYREILKEGPRQMAVFASWENGVLRWRTDGGHTGSQPMKKRPSEQEVQKFMEKTFRGTKIHLDYRKD